MAEQYTPSLGKMPAEDARRDAVHIAVAPVVAAMDLWPGSDVGINSEGRAAFGEGVTDIGIVDPFLLREIHAGERFWLFLYPGSITGLRHVWSHPVFTVKVPTLTDSEAGGLIYHGERT